jgi:hypothetical protein
VQLQTRFLQSPGQKGQSGKRRENTLLKRMKLYNLSYIWQQRLRKEKEIHLHTYLSIIKDVLDVSHHLAGGRCGKIVKGNPRVHSIERSAGKRHGLDWCKSAIRNKLMTVPRRQPRVTDGILNYLPIVPYIFFPLDI